MLRRLYQNIGLLCPFCLPIVSVLLSSCFFVSKHVAAKRPGGTGGGESHSKREEVLVVPFCCPLVCSASKGLQRKLLQYLGIEPKKYDRRLCVALESVLLGGENIQAMPTKQYLCTSYGFFSKFPKSSPVIFIQESPRGPLHQEYYEACQSPGLVFIRLKLSFTSPRIKRLLLI